MWLRCLDEFSPVILEVARKSDFPDLAAFQRAIQDNPLSWEGRRLDYTSRLHDTTLTLYADYTRPPLVDGQPVKYTAARVYDSPFLQSEFGSGIVTIRNGSQQVVLDFNP